jgi:hypothetical protein
MGDCFRQKFENAYILKDALHCVEYYMNFADALYFHGGTR